jgi:MFS family permease
MVLFAVAFGTNVPTPLLLLYQDHLQLTAAATVGIFVIYAAGLILGLVPAGVLSDTHGRRVVTLPSVATAGLATMLFIMGKDSLAVLLVARFMQGAASGAVFGVGSAWLQELSAADGVLAGARRVATALSGGFAMGPVAAGVLGQWAPNPLVMPYLLHAVLMVLAVGSTWAARDAFAPRPGVWPWGRGWEPLAVRERQVWGRFLLPVSFCVFAFPSTSLAVIPLLLRAATDHQHVAVTGGIVAATLLSGALVQPLARRLGVARAAVAAAASGSAGAVLCVLSVAWMGWTLLLPAALLLGAAYGLALFAGLAGVAIITGDSRRGLMTSLFYCVAYCGFAVPWIISAVQPLTGFPVPLGVLGLVGAGLALALTRNGLTID